jgi:hypothetical protein
MNNDIANKIKSSLENYEVPYDASAWDKISQRLDVQSTGNSGNTGGSTFLSSPKTWIVTSIAVIGASLAIYKLRDEQVKTPLISQQTTLSEKVIPQEKSDELVKVNVSTSNKEEVTEIKKKLKQVNELDGVKIIQTTSKSSTTNNSVVNEGNSPINKPSTKAPEKHNRPFVLPKTNKSYCLGEKVEIFNPNGEDIFLTSATGKQVKIESQESVLITLKQEGVYTWNSGDKTAFEVKEKPVANFSLPSDIIYENGIPTITLTSDLDVKNQRWMVDQKVISTKEDLKLNIFNKEKYTVTLHVTGQNGCENQLTRTFYPDPSFNYNLKAPTGFEPTSSNPKRNTFLPLSLLERDTPFRMLIIDPKDGTVIFETNDVNNPWDGKNQKTDQLVPEGSEYIWKVILLKPEKHEKNEYKGMITRK